MDGPACFCTIPHRQLVADTNHGNALSRDCNEQIGAVIGTKHHWRAVKRGRLVLSLASCAAPLILRSRPTWIRMLTSCTPLALPHVCTMHTMLAQECGKSFPNWILGGRLCGVDQDSFPILPLRRWGKVDKTHDRSVDDHREDFCLFFLANFSLAIVILSNSGTRHSQSSRRKKFSSRARSHSHDRCSHIVDILWMLLFLK
jgi:hypothetical protein